MARPWEYLAWRRVVMQACMWLILGGSLGLAELISVHSRNAVESIGTQVQVDRFQVRLPDDWPATRLDDPDAQGIRAADPETHRVLLIVVMRLQSLHQFAGPGISAKHPGGQKIDFTGLHQTGVLRMETQLQDVDGTRVVERSITAAVSVPPDDAIMIKLLVPPGVQIGRSDARLVRDIAARITASSATNDTDDDENGGP
ncbi:MAG TPA: hypothetical protein VN541_24385 [Tepidisphaeraceae bacterium]|nr:hypothetical protein [Tepidisphaeraceae bacterium]